MQTFSDALRVQMKIAGHNQKQLSELVGVSHAAISRIATAGLDGRPDRNPDLESFAKLLQVYPALLAWIVEKTFVCEV